MMCFIIMSYYKIKLWSRNLMGFGAFFCNLKVHIFSFQLGPPFSYFCFSFIHTSLCVVAFWILMINRCNESVKLCFGKGNKQFYFVTPSFLNDVELSHHLVPNIDSYVIWLVKSFLFSYLAESKEDYSNC